MADTPKFTPYIVAAAFRDGPLCVTAIIAESPEMACSVSATSFVRITGTDAELAGVVVVPLTPEFLAAALNVTRGQPPSGTVVSLVPPENVA